MGKRMAVCLIVGLMVAMFAFAGPTKESEAATTTPAGAGAPKGRYAESPMLAERVKKGELPPVDQRLPQNPVVVKVEDKIGKYGGSLRVAVNTQNRVYGSILAGRFTDQDAFLFDKYGGEMAPNWVESATMSADGQTYTIWLRKGVKWSDGVPVTTDDLLFSLVDVAGNKELYPAGVPSWLRGVKLEKVDEYGLKFLLPSPDPLFAYNFKESRPLPKHYMKQFFAPLAKKEDLEAAAKAAKVDTWMQLFILRSDAQNMDKPIVGLWKVVSTSPEKVICERNPYFWKVDAEGNQLPYIDRLEISVLPSADTIVLKDMAGEFDMDFYNPKFSDYPTYKANEKQGGYTVVLWKNAAVSSHIVFNLNFTADPVMGQLLRTADFRKALSYAIDRKEVNKLVYLEQGNAVSISPSFGSPEYEQRFTEMYAQFDPAKANSMLDAIGVRDVNRDGKRELPNGAKLELELNVDNGMPDHIAMSELVKGYWDAVGVSTKINVIPKERRQQLGDAGQFHTSMWKVDDIVYPMYLKEFMIRWLTPTTALPAQWSTYLRTDGKSGEKPPADFQAAYSIYQKATGATDEKQRLSFTKQYWEDYYANLWTIGVIQEVPVPVIVTNRLKNVPKDAVNAWPLRTPSNANLAQFYFD